MTNISIDVDWCQVLISYLLIYYTAADVQNIKCLQDMTLTRRIMTVQLARSNIWVKTTLYMLLVFNQIAAYLLIILLSILMKHVFFLFLVSS